MMVDEFDPVIVFTAADRCDRCNAQAYTLARKANMELFFCGNHSRENRQPLYDDGWEIIDDLAGLEEIGYKLPELV